MWAHGKSSPVKGARLKLFVLLVLLALLVSGGADDYSFYPAFRNWAAETFPRSQRAASDGSVSGIAGPGLENILEKYAAKLRSEGIAESELTRRATLIRTHRQDLENYYWNVALTNPNAAFNHEANAFLVEMVKGRKPGMALDVGAGEGRNSLYLASRDWQVTAIDPAEQALASGHKRAQAAGTPITTVVSTDTDFDFGKDRWDLILYSWVGPAGSAAKVVQSLRPGGIVVFEGGLEWYGVNGLLKMFPTLRVLHYEDVNAKADFFGRREMRVVRFCGEKTP